MSNNINILVDIIERRTIHNTILNEFNKPIHDNIFFKNKQILINESKLYPFDNNAWDFNPRQFSFDVYNEQEYFHIILLVNNLDSYFSFNLLNFKNNKYILAPTKNNIKNVANYSTTIN